MAAPSAGAKAYFCDHKIENMVKQAAKDLENGKVSPAQFEQLQRAIAVQQEKWGC